MRVVVGPDSDTREVACDACACLCDGCDNASVASGFRPHWRRQLSLWGRP